MKQADIFQELSTDKIEKIASICDKKRFGMGEIFFEENTASDELYVVTRGEVETLADPALVSDRQENPFRLSTIATLRRGQSLGEIALADQGLRSATDRSSTSDTRLLHIPRSQLMAICDYEPMGESSVLYPTSKQTSRRAARLRRLTV